MDMRSTSCRLHVIVLQILLKNNDFSCAAGCPLSSSVRWVQGSDAQCSSYLTMHSALRSFSFSHAPPRVCQVTHLVTLFSHNKKRVSTLNLNFAISISASTAGWEKFLILENLPLYQFLSIVLGIYISPFTFNNT